MAKQARNSKMLWANGTGLLIAIVAALTEVSGHKIVSENPYAFLLVMASLAGLNAYLRTITKEPIEKRRRRA